MSALTKAVLAASATRPGVVVTWGQVTQVAPLLVLFAGDTDPTRVGLRSAAYSPVVGDKVKLELVGSQWVAAYKIEGA